MSEEFEDIIDEDTGETLLTKEKLKAVQIDDLQLDDAFKNVPGDLAFWNARGSAAVELWLLEKHELKVVEAKIWLKNRKLTEDVKPRPTERDLIAMMHEHPDWVVANLRFVSAEGEKSKALGFAEAVRAKKDMLQSVGAMLRAEMKGDPVVKRDRQEAREYDD